jgi:hypothetical protein
MIGALVGIGGTPMSAALADPTTERLSTAAASINLFMPNPPVSTGAAFSTHRNLTTQSHEYCDLEATVAINPRHAKVRAQPLAASPVTGWRGSFTSENGHCWREQSPPDDPTGHTPVTRHLIQSTAPIDRVDSIGMTFA